MAARVGLETPTSGTGVRGVVLSTVPVYKCNRLSLSKYQRCL